METEILNQAAKIINPHFKLLFEDSPKSDLHKVLSYWESTLAIQKEEKPVLQDFYDGLELFISSQ